MMDAQFSRYRLFVLAVKGELSPEEGTENQNRRSRMHKLEALTKGVLRDRLFQVEGRLAR